MINKTRNKNITNGSIVRHFKKEKYEGDDKNRYLYKVISINARETDNYNKVVVYEALYDDGKDVHYGDVFVRPYDQFMSEVDTVKYPDYNQIFRFEAL